jgi:sec-independent protein translocase protein TatA
MNIAFISNLAGPDMILILLVLLLLFGAKKLPELAKGMGQAVREFSKAKDEVQSEIMRPSPVAPPQRIEEPKVASSMDIPTTDMHSSPQSQNPAAEPAKEVHPEDPSHQA